MCPLLAKISNLNVGFRSWFLKKSTTIDRLLIFWEPRVGIEPTTSFLPRRRSATELPRLVLVRRMGGGWLTGGNFNHVMISKKGGGGKIEMARIDEW